MRPKYPVTIPVILPAKFRYIYTGEPIFDSTDVASAVDHDIPFIAFGVVRCRIAKLDPALFSGLQPQFVYIHDGHRRSARLSGQLRHQEAHRPRAVDEYVISQSTGQYIPPTYGAGQRLDEGSLVQIGVRLELVDVTRRRDEVLLRSTV